MGKKKDKGVLVYFSPKNRKKVKALIRELGLEFVLVEKTNEAQTLTLSARLDDFAAFDERQSAWVLEAGDYGFSVGQSLAGLADCGSLRIEARTLREVAHIAAPVEDFRRLTRADPAVDGTRSGIVPLGGQIAVPTRSQV